MVDEKARAVAVEVAKEMVADRANHWEIADAVIEAYLQALAPPQMFKLSPEDERLLDKALSASSPAIYEIVPAPLSPGSTGEMEGWVLVPKEPSEGLLMSMAIRRDHGLGAPGYYDMLGDGEHANRLRVAITEARQAYEEIVGAGFHSKERDADYRAMLSAAGERG